jgi:hypothetical protein
MSGYSSQLQGYSAFALAQYPTPFYGGDNMAQSITFPQNPYFGFWGKARMGVPCGEGIINFDLISLTREE